MQTGYYYQPTEFVTFTSDPHTITYTPFQAPFGSTVTGESPGYLGIIFTSQYSVTGWSQGQVAGINDHNSLAMTEYTYNISSYVPVMTPHLYLSNQVDASLGSLGGTNGVANALNNSNEVVGWSQIANGAQHAFLYSNGSMQDLNLLIPPVSGITLVSAVGIDSAGDIVAYGTDSSGQMNEYYLSPAEVPAPSPARWP